MAKYLTLQDLNNDQIVDPEELQQQLRVRQAIEKSSRSARDLLAMAERGGVSNHFSTIDGLPGVNEEIGTPASLIGIGKNIGMGALDLVSRGNYVAATLAENLLQGRPLQAIGGAARELFSGIGSIQGQKRTFRDVLDTMGWVDETRLGDHVRMADGVPLVGDFNLRGTVGLALDIFLDPLTYLSFGGSALTKVPSRFSAGAKRLTPVVEGSTQYLRKPGKELLNQETKRHLDDIIRSPSSAPEVRNAALNLAIEEAQDRLHAQLMDVGQIAPGRAADIAASLSEGVGAILRDPGKSSEDLSKFLKGMNSQTAKKVKTTLGLDSKAGREAMGVAVSRRVESAYNRALLAGLDGPLAGLSADVAYKRAMESVLQAAKSQSDLVGDLGPVMWGTKNHSVTLAKRSLGAIVAESEVGKRTLAAMQKALPTPVIRAAAVSSTYAKQKIDLVGRLLNSEWDARKLTGFHILRRAHIDANHAAVGKMKQQVRVSPLARWYDEVMQTTTKDKDKRRKIFETFAHAIDTGDQAALINLGKGAQRAALFFKQRMREAVTGDVRRGLMQADNVRVNYFPHFIDAPDKLVHRMAAQRPGRKVLAQDDIGRFKELRSFPTLNELRAAAQREGVADKINYDPFVALEQRLTASIEGALHQDFYKSIRKAYGKEIPEVWAEVTSKLGEPLVDPTSAKGRYASWLSRRKITPATLRSLQANPKFGKDGVSEVMRQKMAALPPDQTAIERFLQKYDDFLDDLPAIGLDEKAIDGTPFVTMPPQFKKQFAGAMIPESAAEALKRMRVLDSKSPEMEELIGSFDFFHNKLKAALTIYFPNFHFRNKYSNVAQNFLKIGIEALNPQTSYRAARVYRMAFDFNEGEVLQSTHPKWAETAGDEFLKQEGGVVLTYGDMVRELKRNHIVRSHDTIIEGATVKGRPAVSAQPRAGMTATERARAELPRRARQLTGHIENQDRILLYSEARRRGLSERESTDWVNQMLFDYDDLTEFERMWAKRTVPFWVWSKKNVALQARMLGEAPGMVAVQGKLLRDREEAPALFEYEKDGFRILMDNDGKHVRMLSGIDLPISSVDRMLPLGKLMRLQGGEAFRELLAQTTPLIRVPAEMAAGKTFFDNRTQERVSAHAIGKMLDPEHAVGKVIPDSVREWLSWTKKENLATGRTYYEMDGGKYGLLARSWVQSRFITSADRVFKQLANDEGFLSAALTQLTSLRAVRVNLDEKRARVLDRRIKQIEDELVKRGVAGRFSRTFEYKDSERYRTTR